jgi:hypothetical protein
MTDTNGMFGGRFNYLRWLRFLRSGEAPSFAAIGLAIGRTGAAVSAWVRMAEAPTDYRIHRPLTDYFELKDGAWLIEGRGEPPMPELWPVWERARRADVRTAGATQVISRTNAAAKKSAAAKKRQRGA